MSARRKRTWDSARSLKIDRRCPRCRAHRYHFTHDRKPDSARCGVSCAECGHPWRTRLTLAERGLEVES